MLCTVCGQAAGDVMCCVLCVGRLLEMMCCVLCGQAAGDDVLCTVCVAGCWR